MERKNRLIMYFLDLKYTHHIMKEYDLYSSGLFDFMEDGIDEKHFYGLEEMCFHTDWNWLMVLIRKINELGIMSNMTDELKNYLIVGDLNNSFNIVYIIIAEYYAL